MDAKRDSTHMPDEERFYADLPGFTDFDDVVDFEGYVALPEAWTVLASDVVGSTKAIAAGRYKEVNMLGAAAITAVLNATGGHDLPFAFGGDGGVVAVPPSVAGPGGEALARLAAHAPALFGLSLRVAEIPVNELIARGGELRVRKYELSPGNHLAMFAGNGLELADTILKGDEGVRFAPAVPDEDLPDLSGLSCRWEPLTPRSGVMLSAIIKPLGDSDAARRAVLDAVLARAAAILGHAVAVSTPASPDALRFRWPPSSAWFEARATAGGKGAVSRYARILAESLVQLLCRRFGWRVGAFDAPAYEAELRANTDFRKFDGHLRMVLDTSAAQAAAFEGFLDAEYAAGRLVHGTHQADTALMTCLVFSLEQSEHVHFVDGANGGYAIAARALKGRLGAS